MARLLTFVIKEFREVLPALVFFAISFNLLVLTTDLVLADYRASLGSFMIATTAALVVGKAVLLANATRFLRRFDAGPMIQQVLFKTTVYWSVVFLFRFFRAHWNRWPNSFAYDEQHTRFLSKIASRTN